MRSSGIISVLSLLASSALAIDFSKWTPAAKGDSRSPCPGLNSLANHGILPHNGQGITVPMLTQAMDEVFNIGFDLRTILAVGGLFSSPTALKGYMQLSDLDKHNFIEHDASLSRAMNQTGDDHTFRQDIFDTVLAFFSNDSDATASIAQTSQAHLHRVQVDSAKPGFNYQTKQKILATGESALYQMALGDPTEGNAPVEYIRVLFEEERIPYKEGWRTPATTINVPVALAMMNKIALSGGEAVKEAAITGSSWAKALIGLGDDNDDIPQSVQNLINQLGIGGLFGTSEQ